MKKNNKFHSFAQFMSSNLQLICLLLWIIFVGLEMWQHTQQTLRPPIHDPMQYNEKAYNIWNEVHKHKVFNPFNVPPFFRPPGTVLMSYPFGFDADFRPYFFRSVFLPVLLIALAVVVVGYRRQLDEKSKWLLALFAAFLTTLPCLYGFELSSDLSSQTYYGMVDGFFAGISALAIAAVVRSINFQSLGWAMIAAVVACFSLTVKPTGAVVMALTGLTWLILSSITLKLIWQNTNERKKAVRLFLIGSLAFAVLYAVILVISLSSEYLSPQMLEFGNDAVNILKNDFTIQSWHEVRIILQTGFGFPFIIWLLLMVLLVGRYLWKTSPEGSTLQKSFINGSVLVACFTFLFGLWFWLIGSGGTHFRYFIPFLYMAIVLALPTSLVTVRAMPSGKMALVSVFMVIPVINIVMLLAQHDPPHEWQRWTGVNLTSGEFDPALSQAQSFAKSVKLNGRDVKLYAMTVNAAETDYQSVLAYADITMSPMPIVTYYRPVDWMRPTAFRIAEMLDSDYWLLQPTLDKTVAQSVLANPLVDDYQDEEKLFQTWATQLTEKDGVTVVSETPLVRLLHIDDPSLLDAAFESLIADHHWRSEFLAANPKRRFSENELLLELAANPPSIEHVNFGDRLQLRALFVNRDGNDATLRFWWKAHSPEIENDWRLFIHSIDEKGNIKLNNEVMINTNLRSQSNRPFFAGQITIKNMNLSGANRLGIGFLRLDQGNLSILAADSGLRDMDNRRVIVPLP